MDRMPETNFDGKLDALGTLLREYRDACPDPETGAGFMPGLWQRIEARRMANLTIFRRLAQACVAATIALTIVMGVVLIPRLERLPVYSASYIDVLAADHPNSYVDILNGDIK
jgi:hypothetical protein